MSGLEKRDPWLTLSRFTAARIALGRAGGSVRTQTLLDFRLAHARAKDAVELPFDADALAAELTAAGLESARLETQARDRRTYLQRPDLGRQLPAGRSGFVRCPRRAVVLDVHHDRARGPGPVQQGREFRPDPVGLRDRCLPLQHVALDIDQQQSCGHLHLSRD